MTDDEIIRQLKTAAGALEMYKAIVRPVAEELARQKSLHVFGVEGAYSGDLGCWESGSDYVCLHIKDEFLGKTMEEFERKAGMKPYEFEGEWVRKMLAAGIKSIYLGGHF